MINKDSDFKFAIMKQFGKLSSFIEAFSSEKAKVLEFFMNLHSDQQINQPKKAP